VSRRRTENEISFFGELAHRVSQKLNHLFGGGPPTSSPTMASSAVPLLDSFEDFSTVTPWEK
jgi:hypothetical protein